MSSRFYTSLPLAPGCMVLQGPEAHHLASVCRGRPGDRVTLFNGDGREYLAEIVAAHRKEVQLDIVEVICVNRELPFRLELAVAIPKGDRGDFLVEKLTELGVTDLVPLRTARGVVMPRDAKLQRWQRAVIEASKQCGRNVIMHVHELIDWTEYCADPTHPSSRLIAHPGGGDFQIPASGDIAVAIGPEGGFTAEELQQAIQHGWGLVNLGPRTLRIETAAIAVAARLAAT